MTAACGFYVRTLVTDEPTYRYQFVHVPGPKGDGRRLDEHPPLVGDLVYLYDPQADVKGSFRVIERSWLHSSWGSVNWPLVEDRSKVPPMLDLVVEQADGPFVNEAPTNEDDDG